MYEMSIWIIILPLFAGPVLTAALLAIFYRNYEREMDREFRLDIALLKTKTESNTESLNELSKEIRSKTSEIAQLLAKYRIGQLVHYEDNNGKTVISRIKDIAISGGAIVYITEPDVLDYTSARNYFKKESELSPCKCVPIKKKKRKGKQ